MKKILYMLIVAVFVWIVFIVVTDKNISEFIEERLHVSFEEEQKTKLKNEVEQEGKPIPSNEIERLVGRDVEEIITLLGEPKRKDPTPYGYEWYIYTDGETYQIQVGVREDKVNTVFTIGQGLDVTPISIGDSYEEVKAHHPFKESLTYQNGLSSYTFKLKDTDLESHPIIQLENDVFLQCYFDTFTDELTAVRLMDAETLLQHRMYELEYRGPLPGEIDVTPEQWTAIEASMEKQIFELTNIIRHTFQLNTLLANEETNRVAFLHSKDMYDGQYFSHYRPNGDGLKERLDERNIYYLAAGENIAAQHADGIAATFGWLNSEGHREALLNEEYTHLGVGVYRFYYTQNFLMKP